MKKKEQKNGLLVIMRCGKPGCEIPKYTAPYAGTKEDFQRHYTEEFKEFKKAA